MIEPEGVVTLMRLSKVIAKLLQKIDKMNSSAAYFFKKLSQINSYELHMALEERGKYTTADEVGNISVEGSWQ